MADEKRASSSKKNLSLPPELEELVSQVGNFIQYWGFKNVQGRIWAHLYISKNPLDAADLMARLKVSKALVSISIKEMLEYEVIEEVGKSDRGTILYQAATNQEKVILNVLRKRERMMLSHISSAHSLCSALAEKEKKHFGISAKGLSSMGEMIHSAEAALDLILRGDDPDGKMWSNMEKALDEGLSESS